MRTFLSVKIGLAPLAVFWFLLASGRPATAIAAALALSAAAIAWRLREGEIRSLEIAALVFFAALGACALAGIAWPVAHAGPLSFAALGVFGLASVAARRPWTAEYARAAHADVADNPIFFGVNMLITAVWGVLFLALSAAHVLALGTFVTTGIVVFGALVSIFGPKLLIRALAGRLLRAEETWDWPAPALTGRAGPDACDVAIVGAGLGGLTAAALLADAGATVTVVEQHVVPGGFCHSWLRKVRHGGAPRLFRFDSGVHDISGVWPGGPVSSLFERLGLADRISWHRLDHGYRLPGLAIDVPRDVDAYAAELGRLFPRSAAGLAAFFADIRAVLDGMYASAADNGGIPGRPRTLDALLAFPKRFPVAYHWMNRPFAELLESHVADPAARDLLTALTGYVTDRPHTLTVAEMAPLFGYYVFGGFYPEGGSGRIADLLAEAIAERGGTVLLKSPVARIAVENGRAAGVVLKSGRRITADAVISNADLKHTLCDLVDPAAVPAEIRARFAAAAPATSAFAVQLGLDVVPDIRPVMHVVPQHGRAVGLVAPSLVDPSAAPAGYATLEIMTLLPHAEAQAWFPHQGIHDDHTWRRSDAYAARKRALGDELIAAAASVIPDLARHIVFRCEASPVTYARYDWSSAGAIYGIAREGRLAGSKSPVPGLYVAGAANMGAGVEAVVISGARTAEAIMPGVLARAAAARCEAA